MSVDPDGYPWRDDGHMTNPHDYVPAGAVPSSGWATRHNASRWAYDLMQPNEWGYRDLADGTFIADDAPFRAAEFLCRLAAETTTPSPVEEVVTQGWRPDREMIADVIAAKVSGPLFLPRDQDLKLAHRQDQLAAAAAILALFTTPEELRK